MRLTSKLLTKNAYGFDVSGVVQDATQDNVRDKTSPVRNPEKEDFNPQNMGTDGTAQPDELAQIEAAKQSLNPHMTK
jgi:hypothetical protein